MSMFVNPSAPGSGITWADHKGALLLIEVSDFHTGIKTSYGEADAVEADIHVLDGAGAGQDYAGALIFPKLLVSQTKGSRGKKVLGRLSQGTAKPGQSAPWLLEAASDADTQRAEEWVKKNAPVTQAPAAPF